MQRSFSDLPKDIWNEIIKFMDLPSSMRLFMSSKSLMKEEALHYLLNRDFNFSSSSLSAFADKYLRDQPKTERVMLLRALYQNLHQARALLLRLNLLSAASILSEPGAHSVLLSCFMDEDIHNMIDENFKMVTLDVNNYIYTYSMWLTIAASLQKMKCFKNILTCLEAAYLSTHAQGDVLEFGDDIYPFHAANRVLITLGNNDFQQCLYNKGMVRLPQNNQWVLQLNTSKELRRRFVARAIRDGNNTAVQAMIKSYRDIYNDETMIQAFRYNQMYINLQLMRDRLDMDFLDALEPIDIIKALLLTSHPFCKEAFRLYGTGIIKEYIEDFTFATKLLELFSSKADPHYRNFQLALKISLNIVLDYIEDEEADNESFIQNIIYSNFSKNTVLMRRILCLLADEEDKDFVDRMFLFLVQVFDKENMFIQTKDGIKPLTRELLINFKGLNGGVNQDVGLIKVEDREELRDEKRRRLAP